MDEDILQIREDEYKRNRFIERYKPFLAKYTSSICHRYVHYGIDDELSIALMAFNESIDRYNGEGLFFEFAKMVIKSRLYDYFDSKAYKDQHHELEDHVLNNNAKDSYQEELRKQYLKEEVEELHHLLELYSIDILELYKHRPKHLLSKKHIHDLLVYILKNEKLVSYIVDKGQLPIKEIIDNYPTTRKKIEPYRQYIITIIFIYCGSFEYLKEYLPSEVRSL